MTSESGSAPLSVEQLAELRAAYEFAVTPPWGVTEHFATAAVEAEIKLAKLLRKLAEPLIAAAEENAKLR